MNLQPIAGKVLIELQEQPELSDSGFFIPEHSRAPHNVGRVTAVGPARRGQYIDIAVDHRVIFNPMCLAHDVVEGKLRLLPYEEILAILEPCS